MMDAKPGPDLNTFFAWFDDSVDTPASESIEPLAVPEPYRSLLVHFHHMTVTVEAFYRERVDVLVLARQHRDGWYGRKILLALEQQRSIVQFGLVRIRLDLCTPEVREEILSEKIPLGRVLIEHGVLRWIALTDFLRVTPGPAMCEWFGLARPEPTYGRLGYIFCDHQPAIELLEILAPIPSARSAQDPEIELPPG